jgi:hypothetical protein
MVLDPMSTAVAEAVPKLKFPAESTREVASLEIRVPPNVKAANATDVPNTANTSQNEPSAEIAHRAHLLLVIELIFDWARLSTHYTISKNQGVWISGNSPYFLRGRGFPTPAVGTRYLSAQQVLRTPSFLRLRESPQETRLRSFGNKVRRGAAKSPAHHAREHDSPMIQKVLFSRECAYPGGLLGARRSRPLSAARSARVEWRGSRLSAIGIWWESHAESSGIAPTVAAPPPWRGRGQLRDTRVEVPRQPVGDSVPARRMRERPYSPTPPS